MIFLQFFQRKHILPSTIHFTSDDILMRITKNPDPNKTHGHDKYVDNKYL